MAGFTLKPKPTSYPVLACQEWSRGQSHVAATSQWPFMVRWPFMVQCFGRASKGTRCVPSLQLCSSGYPTTWCLGTKQFKKGIAKKRRKVIDIWQNFWKFIYYPNQWVPSINTKGVFFCLVTLEDKCITRIRGTHEVVLKHRICILAMTLSKGITWHKETAKKFLYKTYSHNSLKQNKVIQ
jgi:hypothetical protein